MNSASRENGRVLMTAEWVVGHAEGKHILIPSGEVVFENGKIIFVGSDFSGHVARRIDYGKSLIGPGFIDLDALSDLDTTVLALDNQPAWKKGRVWPESYMAKGPREMYTPEELIWQKRYAFTRLISNGITTALPIASLFYREWGEKWEEFEGAAQAAEDLGLRVYLGPAYRTGNSFVSNTGKIDFYFNEEQGMKGLEQASQFAKSFEGRAGGLIRTMLSPDRIETCTEKLLVKTAAVGRELDIPVRLHCCQSALEYNTVVSMYAKSPAEWLRDLKFLSHKTILPHLTHISGSNGITYVAPDLEIFADSGASLAHCPLVMARGGAALHSFKKFCDAGMNIGMGTDTHPPDMILNMQMALYTARLTEQSATAASAGEVYTAATVGGADALGRNDLGRLKPGSRADITVINLENPTMGQLIDPIQTIMLNASGRDVDTVVIDGRFVMCDGKIPGLEHTVMWERAQKQFNKLVQQYPDRTFKHPKIDEIFKTSFKVVK